MARLGQFWLFVLACCWRAAGDDVGETNLPPAAVEQIMFSRDIQPIFDENCLRCHGPAKPRSNFRLDNRDGALAGGDNNTNDIVPGDSGRSLLIAYVARQVPDMEMPPNGKGAPLTLQEVGLLRAWIDQGAVWETPPLTNDIHGQLTAVLGGTTVHGDAGNYRELNWQQNGVIGGEEFQFFQQTTPNTRWILNGRILPNDYEMDLNLDQNGLGYIHSGWQQYRKYYDDLGGYDPSLIQPVPTLGEDLYLDIGKAWIDFGFTRPNRPQMVLGYEYDYRRGNEATTEWGAVGTNLTTTRNLAPASEYINESVNVIKFKLEDEIEGASVTEDFRGEFYRLATSGTNTVFPLVEQDESQGTSYFQGANTIRVEKKFNDWLLGSAGYLYSKLNADSSFSFDYVGDESASIPRITLERQSNVGNLNALLGPFDGLFITVAGQGEWSRQSGFGAGNFDEPPPPFTVLAVPFTVSSEYDETSFQENFALRYSNIPFTGLYAEARTKQDDINQSDQFSAPEEVLNKAVFSQNTVSHEQSDDLRVGFDTSPWQTVAFNAHYRFLDDYTYYDSAPLVEPISPTTGYPTFILSHAIITHEAEAELVLHPTPLLKTTLSYEYQISDYDVNTLSYVFFGSVITPGGGLTGGTEYSHIVSLNATLTPVPRLYLSTLFSWQLSSLNTASDGSPAVVPYKGDVYTVLADGTYVLNRTTDLFLGYYFSEANYAQNNFAGGLPLGIEYQQHSIQVALTHRFSDDVSMKLQYRFAYYDEPSDGGAANYRANSIFGTLTWRF